MPIAVKNVTPQPIKDAITKAVTDVGETLVNLYCRWLDEQEYEDINDYAAPIKLPDGLKLVKMNKRPFGFDLKAEAFPEALYRVYVTSRSSGWKRIK